VGSLQAEGLISLRRLAIIDETRGYVPAITLMFFYVCVGVVKIIGAIWNLQLYFSTIFYLQPQIAKSSSAALPGVF
jgi:hypothetical protein